MKYDYLKVKREISGFGGGYEQACRNMVVAALEWWDKNPEADLSYQEFENVYGLTTGESPDMKKAQEEMLKASGNDCTGAMMQACMSHLLFIVKNGWDEYVEKMNKEQ